MHDDLGALGQGGPHADILREAGAPDLAALSNPPRVPYHYVVPVPSIADGGTLEIPTLTDAGTVFVLREICIALQSGITPIPLAEPGPTAASNTAVWLQRVHFSFRTQNVRYFSTPDGVPVNMFATRGGYSRYLIDSAVIAGGQTVYTRLANFAGANIQSGTVVYRGLRVELRR